VEKDMRMNKQTAKKAKGVSAMLKFCIVSIVLIYSYSTDAAFESFKRKLPIVKSDGEKIQVIVDKNDIKAAIKVWQESRWKNDEIIAARKKNGKVRTKDLAVMCNLKEMQSIADLLVADYIVAVNLLDAFQSTPNELEAVKALVAAISLEDVAKMMADAAKVMLSLKDLKEKAQNNKWEFMKDAYLITLMSSSMNGGFKIVKTILEKEVNK
jgi:phosphoribosylformimino-5-aminoimidazole carboxamide ribonucleotide (ProFAR) isomerase